MDQTIGIPPFVNNEHYYFMPGIDGPYLNLAFIEGWAYFYSGVSMDTKFLVNYNNDMQPNSIINLEQPYPDVPHTLELSPFDPPFTNPIFEGAHVDGAIAEALWDVYDTPNDDNYYMGGVLWGHNNDHNGYYSWSELDVILEVFVGYHPRPGDPDHYYCWNIYEFIHGWRKLGYPVDAVFTNIFEAHNVPVFLPGDINDDGRIDVLDIIQFIDWKYKGQPWPPVHCPSADVNADCEINIVDVLYLVDYKFKNGEEPLAGCYENISWPQHCN